ncbi:MAG TPA: acyl-CoA dehydrogenase family protein, partial [Baekduia sp.]|nr:acyl-CoA dehydrogenase family protein [Baekduia sp.]
GLVGFLRERSSEIDEVGTLTRDVVEALDEAGVYRLGIPREFGGLNPISAREQVEMYFQLGRGNLSAAWCVQVEVSGALPVQDWGERAAEEVYRGGHVGPLTAGSLFNVAHAVGVAERVDGGLMVHGSWSFCSGIRAAAWLEAGVTCNEPDGTQTNHMVLIPRSDFKIADDWHVSGMKGSGSNSAYIPEPVFVPDYRIQPLMLDIAAELEDGGASTADPFAGLYVPAMMTGAAQGALEVFVEKIKSRAPWGQPYPRIADMPTVQMLLGHVDARIYAARTALDSWAEQLQTTTLTGGFGDRFGTALLSINIEMRDLIVEMRDVIGSSTAAQDDALGRFAQDASTLCFHGVHRYGWWAESYGRSLLDIDPPQQPGLTSSLLAPKVVTTHTELIETDPRVIWHSDSVNRAVDIPGRGPLYEMDEL